MVLAHWWARGQLCVMIFAQHWCVGQQRAGREDAHGAERRTAAGVTPAETGALIPNISTPWHA